MLLSNFIKVVLIFMVIIVFSIFPLSIMNTNRNIKNNIDKSFYCLKSSNDNSNNNNNNNKREVKKKSKTTKEKNNNFGIIRQQEDIQSSWKVSDSFNSTTLKLLFGITVVVLLIL